MENVGIGLEVPRLVRVTFKEDTRNPHRKVRDLVMWITANQGSFVKIPDVSLRPFNEIPSQTELKYEFRGGLPYHDSPEVMDKIYSIIGELKALIPMDKTDEFIEWSKSQDYDKSAYIEKKNNG